MAIWMVRGLLDVDIWLNGLSVVLERCLNGNWDRPRSFRGCYMEIVIVRCLSEVPE